MTQEDKNLLIKDLCARLPYGVKCEYDGKVIDVISVNLYGEVYPDGVTYTLPIDDVKPYLRPMSSMTDEERLELSKITHCNILYINDAIGVTFKLLDDATFLDNIKAIDFLNSHHFDYRGLIPMGLALEAPEGMYKF